MTLIAINLEDQSIAMEISRLLTNVCSRNIEASKNFYTSLFDFDVAFDSDWFVNLVSAGKGFEIGIILQEHDIIPEHVSGSIKGVYLTFVVENVDTIFQKAQSSKLKIIQPPEVTPYGQKRMLIEAPEGTVCDVSSPAS